MPVLEQQFNGTFNHADFDDPSSMIEALTGVRPELDPEYDLTRLAEKDRLQIRIDKNNAPKEMVIRFAEQMAYSAFPPIVVTADDRTVDGNTRVASYRRRDQRFAPALVIPISYDDAEPEMQLRLQFLGHALNNSNGKTLDRVERRAMAREAIALAMRDSGSHSWPGPPPPCRRPPGRHDDRSASRSTYLPRTRQVARRSGLPRPARALPWVWARAVRLPSR